MSNVATKVKLKEMQPDVIDRVLGKGEYRLWSDAYEQFSYEQDRAYEHLDKFSSFWSRHRAVRLNDDLKIVEKISWDYLELLLAVSKNPNAVVRRHSSLIRDVYSAATDVLCTVNDVLDLLYQRGVILVVAGVTGAGLERKAVALKTRLAVLKKALEKAKQEKNEAWMQGGINLLITGITLYTSPLGFIAAGSLALGQIILDGWLGPPVDGIADFGSKSASSAGAFASGCESFLKRSSQGEDFADAIATAKRAGKKIAIVSTGFDAYEIWIGYKNLDELEKAFTDVKSAYGDLSYEIEDRKIQLKDLRAKFDTQGHELRGACEEQRRRLDGEMRRTGYWP